MNRTNYVVLAQISEQTGRFDDMAEMMKGVVKHGGTLNKEERALLSTAYRHLVGERRVAWRMIGSGYCNRERNQEMHSMLDIIRCRIEDEITEYCEDMQDLLHRVLQAEVSSEGRVSLLKMKGDYFRYVAEIRTHEALNECLELAHDSYMKAYLLAIKSLSPINDTRLGLALNFSVFFYEVVKNTEKAIVLAKETYRSGLERVDEGEKASKEAVIVMKLMRDNISLWNNLLNMEALRMERKENQAQMHNHQHQLAELRHEDDDYNFNGESIIDKGSLKVNANSPETFSPGGYSDLFELHTKLSPHHPTGSRFRSCDGNYVKSFDNDATTSSSVQSSMNIPYDEDYKVRQSPILEARRLSLYQSPSKGSNIQSPCSSSLELSPTSQCKRSPSSFHGGEASPIMKQTFTSSPGSANGAVESGRSFNQEQVRMSPQRGEEQYSLACYQEQMD